MKLGHQFNVVELVTGLSPAQIQAAAARVGIAPADYERLAVDAHESAFDAFPDKDNFAACEAHAAHLLATMAARLLEENSPDWSPHPEVFTGAHGAEDFISAIDELRARDQWVAWRLVTRPGAAKPTKPPVSPHTGGPASHSDPQTWSSYAKAEACARRYGLAGVGFVLTDDDGFTGVDLDKCRDPATGEIAPWAQAILNLAETYAEVSPSGTGIRMIARGKMVDKAVKSDVAHVEIYVSQRYLTITGHHIEWTPNEIREAPETIAALIARVEAMRPKRDEPDSPTILPTSGERSVSPTTLSASVTAGHRAWAAKALETHVAELSTTLEGGRDNELVRRAFMMGQIIARGWIDAATVSVALEGACRTNGLFKEAGAKAIRDKINARFAAGRLSPHEDLPESDYGSDPEAEALGEQIAARLIQMADGSVVDEETGEINPGGPDRAEAKCSAKVIELETVNAASLAGKPVPEMEWLVPDMIPSRNVTMLSGDGGAGKSTLAIQLATASATGGDWLGFKIAVSRVVYVSAEDELDELHRRLARMSPDLTRLGYLTIVPLAGKDAVLAAPSGKEGLLRPTEIYAALRRIIESHRADFVVLDTLADLFGGDELKKVHARQFIGLLRGMALDFECTILLLSHPSLSGMARGDGASGNVAWNNSVRSRLYFERRLTRDGARTVEDDRDIRILSVKKNNRAPNGGQIVVRYDRGQFVRENSLDLTAADMAREAERVFLRLLAQFEREGRHVSPSTSPTYAPTVFAKHPDNDGFGKLALEKAMNRLLAADRVAIEPYGPPSRQRHRLYTVNKSEGYDNDSCGGNHE